MGTALVELRANKISPPASRKSRISFAVKLGPRPRTWLRQFLNFTRLDEGFELTLRLDWEEDDVVVSLLAQVAQLQVGVFGSRMADLVASAWRGGQVISNRRRADVIFEAHILSKSPRNFEYSCLSSTSSQMLKRRSPVALIACATAARNSSRQERTAFIFYAQPAAYWK